MLTWVDDRRFVLGDTRFHAMPPDMLTAGAPLNLADDEFFIFKSRSMIDRHLAIIERLAPRNVFELGFFGGGSTLFLAETARPRRLVCIDRQPLTENRERVERRAREVGLGDNVRTYGGVDQADRGRLAAICAEDFGGEPLDLVIDDCSHLYEPTRASFNELFPRLRPGGVFVIEDWRWAHTPLGEEPLEGLMPDEVPLTRLLMEIVLAIPGIPGLVDEIAVELDFAVIRRGEAAVEPGTFDVTAASNPRGQAMLTQAEVEA